MFYEYALEPAVISSWDRTRFYLDAFGPWTGRFLAKYPKDWKKRIIDSLNCPDVERARIIERLHVLDPRVFSKRPGAPYDGNRPWIENALIEHGRDPFHAIITLGRSELDYVLDGANLDNRVSRWRVETGKLIARDSDEFVSRLQLLLKSSSRIVVIDPYFRPDYEDKVKPIAAICRAVQPGASVEVHRSTRDPNPSHEFCFGDAAIPLIRTLPVGTQVTIHSWNERTDGARFHNRYLLTEIGGVKFGDSIENGGASHEDHVSILDDSSHSKLWQQYVGETLAFESAGEPGTLIGKGRLG